MKVLIFGASSGVGATLLEQMREEHECITFGRQVVDSDAHYYFDALDDSHVLPEIEGIDGLVYLPGSINLKPFHRLSKEDFLKEYQIALLGAVAVLSHYKKAFNKGANIVLMSSVAAAKGMPFHTSVSATKGAVEGFAKSLAAEWAPNVLVNVIAPSLIDTPLAAHLLKNEEAHEKMAQNHPLKRILNAEEVAQWIRFLIVNNQAMTAQILSLDNGKKDIS